MSNLKDRLPPNSIEAEQGILGCILIAPRDSMDLCGEKGVSDSWFYDLRHGLLFSVLDRMYLSNDRIDLITVQQRLKDSNELEGVGGLAYLSALMDAVPSAANLSYYLDIVREKNILRGMLQVCTRVLGRVHEHEGNVDALLEETEKEIQKVSEARFDGGKSRVLEPRESARAFTDDLQRRFELKGALSGIGTGFTRLDKMTSGLQTGELFVIGARPSGGKTAVSCAIVSKACLDNQIPTAFITCEMSPHSILRRIASGRLRIPSGYLRDGSFSEGDFKKLIGFNSMIARSNLHFIDGVSGITIAQIASELRRLVRNKGVKLVIVDYLQKIRPSQSKEKRTYEVGAVSEALKGLAASLGVAMVALAQLNREPDKDKGRQPKASDLADSAQIERDADLIGLIHRIRTEEDPQGTKAKLIIAKQRDGEVGIVELNFNPTYVEFTDVIDVD